MPSFEEVIAGADLDEMNDLGELLSKGPVDMTPLLTRRFAWDITQCALVPQLLEALHMQLGSEEGMNQDHRESHQRMASVLPLENMIQAYGHVLASVVTKALMVTNAVDIDEANEASFVSQNHEVITSSVRAVLAQLMFAGVIQYGPAAGAFAVSLHECDDDEDEGEEGEVV